MLSRSALWLVIAVVCLFIPGCGPLTRLDAVPLAAEEQAMVLELPGATPPTEKPACRILRLSNWTRFKGNSGQS
jgi:hypothetical protein